jgi:hypothetical protein
VIPRTYVPGRHTVFIAMFLGLIEAAQAKATQGKEQSLQPAMR